MPRSFLCPILAAFVYIAVVGPACAAAAEVHTLPSQQVPQLSPKPAPLMRQPGETPAPLHLPGPQGNTREIPLPEVFRGCWSGSVPVVDSLQPLRPGVGRLIWLTKTYTLCYKQAGYGGKWQLTFAQGRVADSDEASDERQFIKVKSVYGPNRAQLTAYLHFRTHSFVTLWGASRGDTLDELTHLYCDVLPERKMMVVRAAVFVERNGQPDVSLTWHANFIRIG